MRRLAAADADRRVEPSTEDVAPVLTLIRN